MQYNEIDPVPTVICRTWTFVGVCMSVRYRADSTLGPLSSLHYFCKVWQPTHIKETFQLRNVNIPIIQ